MKKILIMLVSLILLYSCKKDLTLSEKNTFISQRNLHEQTFGSLIFSNEKQWDSLNDISIKPTQLKNGKVHPDYRTFGWHLYSNGSLYKNYNFAMLWGISYFSYSILPETGGYKNIHQWKTTALVDSAKANDCKVFLSVSNFGSKNNSIFLGNPKAQSTLIDSISSLLALRNADGINIDFEGLPKENKEEFTKFIIQISKKLKEVNSKYMISLCLYSVDWNDVFNITEIDPYIDFYTLMSYDYYGSFSTTTGPIAPLKDSHKFGNGIETSVNSYINKGVYPKKLIVGVPYYGVEWYTERPKIGAKVKKYKSHPAYNTIRRIDIDSLKTPIQFNARSASSYMILKDSNSSYRQLWFEDVKSLSIKYDWVKKNKIGGVGIWALGYDDGYSELWDLLYNKFSEEQNQFSNNNK